MNLKLIPFAVLTSFLAINSYARLDSVSQERLTTYINSNLLSESTDTGKIRGLWYDKTRKAWRSGNNPVYDTFAGLSYSELQNWDYSWESSQDLLYWLNDVALSRMDGKISGDEAMALLTDIACKSGDKSYEGLWIPLEALVNLKTSRNLHIWYGDDGGLRYYDWSGVDFSKLSPTNRIDIESTFYKGKVDQLDKFINIIDQSRNIDPQLFLDGGFKLWGNMDLTGFTSDQISNAHENAQGAYKYMKLDPNISLYDSQGNYILKGRTVKADLSDRKDFDPVLLTQADYYKTKFPPMTLTGSEDFTGRRYSDCDFTRVQGLTEAQLRQAKTIDKIRITSAQYEQFKAFFDENPNNEYGIYVDGRFIRLPQH